jgi:DNA-binding beta-propeller fold protein YncE
MSMATGGSTLLAGGDAFFADNLFLFGDKDASGSAARLQHPLATACAPRSTAVYFADSYNHKIKVVDSASGAVRTIAGGGAAGISDGFGGNAQFSEPGGLAVLQDGAILVADTNNSTIRKLSPVSPTRGLGGGSGAAWNVATVQLLDVPEVSTRELLDSRGGDAVGVPKGAALIQVGTLEGLTGSIRVSLKLPEGYHLTEGAGSGWEASVKGTSGSSDDVAVQVCTPSDSCMHACMLACLQTCMHAWARHI